MTKTEKFYCDLLESLGVKILEDDKTLNYAYGKDGAYEPIRIDGKEVVIPTKENLKRSIEFWNDRTAFHPIVEQSLRNDSKSLKLVQSLINWRLIESLASLAKRLTAIAAHPEIPKNLNPAQHVLLDALVDVNKKSVKYVSDIVETSLIKGSDYRLIKSFIKRGGKHEGKKHSAVLINTFSMFENDNIDKDKRTIFGVKAPRISDLDAIPDLFKLILPKSDIVGGEEYNASSNDDTAPRLHALLKGYEKIATRLNYLLDLYGMYIEGYEDQLIDLTWTEQLDSFRKIRHDIPPLEDNYGESIDPSRENNQGSKKLRPSDNIDETGHTCKNTNANVKSFNNRNNDVDPKHSVASNGQQQSKSTNSKRSNKMSFNPMMMNALMNNSSSNGIDPMTMMMMNGGDVDPMTMMMMNQSNSENKGNNMDLNKLMMLQAMGGDSKIDPMMLMMMNGDSKIDPMTMMMLNQNKDGDNKMNPLLMSQLMNGDSDIDPMMLMMMNGDSKIDPMTLMMLNQNKDGGDSKIDPMMLMMMNGDSKIDPMTLMMLNQNKDGGDSKIDPMMLMMMNQNKDGDNKMNPLLMSQLMNGDSDIDPMMLMAMSGGDIDPMMLMMMNQKKAKKGETTTPAQPKPKYNKD